MAKLYGQVKGMARSRATRCGSADSHIRSSVQSYDGSVITEMYYDDDVLMLRIEMAEGTRFSGKEVFDGTLEEFERKMRG